MWWGSVSPVVGVGVWSPSGHNTSSLGVETMAALVNIPTVEPDKKKHEVKCCVDFCYLSP